MSLWQAVLLGVLQGLAEFLPISSSGHLALMHHFLGVAEAQVFFDVMLHVGTLGAVVIVYWRDLLRLTASGLGALARGDSYRRPLVTLRKSPDLRLLLLLFLGSIPTALIGFLAKDPFESLFHRPVVVACMLIVTGITLLLPRWLGREGTAGGEVRAWHAPLIGAVQGLAIIPGISRSGSTISAALLLGVDTATAARFSFLLSIPAILGAVVLKLGEVGEVTIAPGIVVAGMLASFAVGWAALVLLLRMLRRGRFGVFAYYCFALATVALVLLLAG